MSRLDPFVTDTKDADLLGAASSFVPPLVEVLPGEVHDECGADTRQPPHDFRHDGDRDDGLVFFHPLENDPGTSFGGYGKAFPGG